MMKKLIELLDDIQLRGEDFTDYEIYGMRLPNTVSNDDVADHLIANGVTIPVRCKDCTEWDERNQECGHWYGFHENDFCSYGERKDNDCI